MAAHHGEDWRGVTAIERMPYDPGTWDDVIARYPDAEVFHSTAWLAFLTATQGAEPVVAVVRQGEVPVVAHVFDQRPTKCDGPWPQHSISSEFVQLARFVHTVR